MSLTLTEKIRIILKRENKTITLLAELLGQSRQNFMNKLNRSNFTVRELIEIANALNITFEYNFVLSDGSKI